MISRFFWSLVALGFPWIILLLDDNPGGALVALIMQATVIGWIPASIWALRVVYGNSESKKKKPQ
ncbi:MULTISPECIES: hypothetical protein [unclassified Legionella]|uniref:hypothetical protein n=1 Tax=unclassified Legionella TaxID=2622702 RepID=UPI001055BFA8|nr:MULTISPECIES: hypothetical protein [unclassified Legionella]MDI9818955.1 hypothetical protein [Legionella sp. PL877]